MLGARMARASARTTPAPSGLSPRKQRALQTRRRMLEAAYRLFCAHGYAETTMVAIAEAADVAVQTLYFTFHTKGAILGEVLGAAVLGFERWPGPLPEPVADRQLLDLHPWFAAFEREPVAAVALAMFVDEALPPLFRSAPLLTAMHAAAGDPDVHAVMHRGERQRVSLWTTAVKLLAKKRGGLRAGVTAARGADILLVLLGNETVDGLRGRGWSHAECRRWLVDVLGQQLLGRAP